MLRWQPHYECQCQGCLKCHACAIVWMDAAQTGLMYRCCHLIHTASSILRVSQHKHIHYISKRLLSILAVTQYRCERGMEKVAAHSHCTRPAPPVRQPRLEHLAARHQETAAQPVHTPRATVRLQTHSNDTKKHVSMLYVPFDGHPHAQLPLYELSHRTCSTQQHRSEG